MTFPLENDISTQATVIFVDFLRQVSLAADLAEKHMKECDKEQLSGLWTVSSLKKTLESELLSSFDGPLGVEPTFTALLQMYEDQGRPWKCNFSEKPESHSKTSDSYQGKLKLTSLHEAARSQNMGRIAEAIDDAEDVSARDILGWTPLHYGVRQHDVVTALLRSPRTDINAQDLIEWTPLHYACKSQEKADEKIDYEAARLYGTVGSMHYNTILRLLDRGADINAQGRDGVAPIHCTAMTGFVEAVKLLTKAGADINVLDGSGKTALHWAAFYGKQATVEYLWNIAKRTLRDREGRTSLHLAVISGEWETARWFINNDADVMARDQYMRIPLHQAAWDGMLDVVQLMCEKSPTAANTSDSAGLTPLRCAVENGQEAVVQWLLEHTGAEVNHIWQGNSLVLSAIRGSHAGVVEVLIKHGASLTGRSRNGMSLLHESIRYGNEEITEMLLKAGVRDSSDDDGNSVIKMAKGVEK
ncbi:hypothetical protein CSIM01_08169 [Colletotrichum simmondsii]|uniref:Uncharacterized protein n=1 Tax=Colletotrichum simmondsii TaxID=703756 RepID=A0A135SPJ5_9PEZI|nr:hypothetical protein CSIM01_08169 [Colletotrichum simmondsii]